MFQFNWPSDPIDIPIQLAASIVLTGPTSYYPSSFPRLPSHGPVFALTGHRIGKKASFDDGGDGLRRLLIPIGVAAFVFQSIDGHVPDLLFFT
jgi:hypothetical protein